MFLGNEVLRAVRWEPGVWPLPEPEIELADYDRLVKDEIERVFGPRFLATFETPAGAAEAVIIQPDGAAVYVLALQVPVACVSPRGWLAGEGVALADERLPRGVIEDVQRDEAPVTGNPKDAFELAAKEAESDATKRALVTFGDAFGLNLYDRGTNAQAAQASQQAKRNPPTPAPRQAAPAAAPIQVQPPAKAEALAGAATPVGAFLASHERLRGGEAKVRAVLTNPADKAALARWGVAIMGQIQEATPQDAYAIVAAHQPDLEALATVNSAAMQKVLAAAVARVTA
jgi:hypothetical protein